MATTRGKAEQFRKALHQSVQELLEQFSIAKEDVTVTATINIQEQVRYTSTAVGDEEGDD